MMQTFNIPVGISDFSEIRQNGYYYVDKTGLIAELLNNSAAKVTLITRPRRFGKTLGMSMLAAFFDIHKAVHRGSIKRHAMVKCLRQFGRHDGYVF